MYISDYEKETETERETETEAGTGTETETVTVWTCFGWLRHYHMVTLLSTVLLNLFTGIYKFATATTARSAYAPPWTW